MVNVSGKAFSVIFAVAFGFAVCGSSAAFAEGHYNIKTPDLRTVQVLMSKAKIYKDKTGVIFHGGKGNYGYGTGPSSLVVEVAPILVGGRFLKDANGAVMVTVTIRETGKVTVQTILTSGAFNGKFSETVTLTNARGKVTKQAVTIKASGAAGSKVLKTQETSIKYHANGRVQERKTSVWDVGTGQTIETVDTYTAAGVLDSHTKTSIAPNGTRTVLEAAARAVKTEVISDKSGTTFTVERTYDIKGRLVKKTEPSIDKDGNFYKDATGKVLSDTRTFTYNVKGQLIGETTTGIYTDPSNPAMDGTLAVFVFKFDPKKNYDPEAPNNAGGTNFDPASSKTPISYTQKNYRIQPNGAKKLVLTGSVVNKFDKVTGNVIQTTTAYRTLEKTGPLGLSSVKAVQKFSPTGSLLSSVWNDAVTGVKMESRYNAAGIETYYFYSDLKNKDVNSRFSNLIQRDDFGNQTRETDIFYSDGKKHTSDYVSTNRYVNGKLASVETKGYQDGKLDYTSNSNYATYGEQTLLMSFDYKFTSPDMYDSKTIYRRDSTGKLLSVREENIDKKDASQSYYRETISVTTEDEFGNWEGEWGEAQPLEAGADNAQPQGDLMMVAERADLIDQMEPDVDMPQVQPQEAPKDAVLVK